MFIVEYIYIISSAWVKIGRHIPIASGCQWTEGGSGGPAAEPLTFKVYNTSESEYEKLGKGDLEQNPGS
jgi:hypothetical protein